MKTFVVTIARPALKEQVLSVISGIPIIPDGSVASIKTAPVGTGPFAFVSFSVTEGTVELSANRKYWGETDRKSRNCS